MAYIAMAYTVITYIVIPCIVMAYIFMDNIVMAFLVMAPTTGHQCSCMAYYYRHFRYRQLEPKDVGGVMARLEIRLGAQLDLVCGIG